MATAFYVLDGFSPHYITILYYLTQKYIMDHNQWYNRSTVYIWPSAVARIWLNSGRIVTSFSPQQKKTDPKTMKWSWSLSLRLVYPVLHKPPGATITCWSAVRIRINFWRMVGLYISFGDWATRPMHLSVEGLRPWDWSYPVLQYLREWPTPTVVSSLSRVLS